MSADGRHQRHLYSVKPPSPPGPSEARAACRLSSILVSNTTPNTTLALGLTESGFQQCQLASFLPQLCLNLLAAWYLRYGS